MGFLKRLFGGMNDMPQGDEEEVEETMAEESEEEAVEDIV